MKNVMLTVVMVVLCLCLPAQADIWVFGDSDAIGIRVGGDVVDPNIEVGASVLWLPDIEKPVAYGLYALYHLPKILELPNPLTLSETISGHLYAGGKFDVDARFEECMFSPIFGFIFTGDDESGISAFIEYQFESFDRTQVGESKLMMGVRIPF